MGGAVLPVRKKPMTTHHEICWDAVRWIDELQQADADATIETMLDRIIVVLRRDPRMPRLGSDEWRLLFAGAVARGREEARWSKARPTSTR
jgi:ketosteroid isomerase-like protein